MPFVKLDCGILNSTLWFERECREVFLTALLMAEPFEVLEPMPQFETIGFNQTGFVVPPGWYGFVPAASVGILHRAGVTEKDGFLALDKLAAPEANSRSADFDGRRMVRIDGGFLILNYIKYRERDYTTAERSKRYRERKMAAKKDTAPHRDVTESRRDITQAEAEVEVRTKTQSVRVVPKPSADISTELAERAGRFVERYSQLYTERRKGAKYLRRQPALDWDRACKLCETWDDARLEQMAIIFLITDDEWISGTDRGFAVFASKATWADDRLAEWEAKQRKA